MEVLVSDIQELWMVNSKLTFGLDEPSESTLLRQLQESMEELKGQIKKLNSWNQTALLAISFGAELYRSF